MANGSAALQLLAPEIPAAPAFTTAQEIEIGAAAAAVVVAIAMAMDDYKKAGELTPASKTWAGAMLARMAQLRLDTLDGHPRDEFDAVAYREGKRALHARPDGVILARLEPPCQVDVIISSVLEIVGRIVASELAYRSN